MLFMRIPEYYLWIEIEWLPCHTKSSPDMIGHIHEVPEKSGLANLFLIC